MGNRQHKRNNYQSSDYIPKASSAPTIYSSNLNMDDESSPTTIKVASKTSSNNHKSKSTLSSRSNIVVSSSTTSSLKSSEQKQSSPLGKRETTQVKGSSPSLRIAASTAKDSAIPSAHIPKTSTSSIVKSSNVVATSTTTSLNSHNETSSSTVNQIQQPQQPDVRSGNSTPTAAFSHQSSIESITNSSQRNSNPKLINNTSEPKASSPPSSKSWFKANESSLTSITADTDKSNLNESSKNLLNPETTKVMHIESVEDFSTLEEPVKEKEVMHHCNTLPDMSLPCSSEFQEAVEEAPRKRSLSLAPNSSRQPPVFLAVQNSAHASSRRKLKLAKSPTISIPTEISIQQDNQKKEEKVPKMNEVLPPIRSNQRPDSVDTSNANKGNITKLKLEKVPKQEDIEKSEAPLFSPVKSPKMKSPKQKQKTTSPTKITHSTNNSTDESFSRSSTSSSSATTPSMAQSLFSSSDERKSFCSAALDFQKNWFNDLMGRREQVTVEHHTDSLHNPTHFSSHKISSSPYSIYSQQPTTSAAAIFDTRRRHSVFESKNITAVPLIAVSCPPNPAQSLDPLDGTNTTHLSVNAEKKARIAKKKRNLNNASPKKRSIVSTSCNYSSLSSYKMTSKKSK